MVPSGPPTQVGGNPTVSPATLLRTNSSLLGGQGGGAPSQPGYPSLVNSRSQYSNMNILGNLSNVSSIPGGGNPNIGLNQAFNNGGNVASQTTASNSGISGSTNLQRGLAMGSDSIPLSGVGGSMGFPSSGASFSSTNLNMNGSSGPSGSIFRPGGSGSTGPHHGQPQMQHFTSSNSQLSQDQQAQQLEQHKFQQGQQTQLQQGQQAQEMSLQPQGQTMLQGGRGLQQFQGQHVLGLGASQQQQMQSLRGLTSEQAGQQQQLQSLRNLASAKLDQQQLQSLRSLASVKMEPGEQSLLLHQQQQLLQLSRQPPQQIQLQAAQMNLLQQQQQQQQQRILQQHQQRLHTFPQQRSQLQQQPLQQLQQQNLQVGAPTKSPVYESGMCARRLMQYMFHQQHRPEDNSIDFWRKFVSEYFGPHAKKRWCVSLYGSGRQTTGVFPQDVWHCEICGTKPGRGFETTVEVLPRLCKIKYDSGTLEELLYVDVPREYPTPSGHIVLEYGKAIQESVFEQLRVVRDGQLRIVFSSDLKICSWEFCARSHEELIPRRLLIPQVSQLGAIAQKYQTSVQNGTTNLSSQDLQSNCNMFVATARQLTKTLEVPLVNDLGYTKRYVRCLQISEVVNSMKDLIDFSRENKTGPIESLNNFPRRTPRSVGLQNQVAQPQEQNGSQTLSSEQSAGQPTAMKLVANNVINSVNNSVSTASHTSSPSTIAGLLHQNSMNSRQSSLLSGVTTSFGSTIQVPPVGSSNSVQQSQLHSAPSFPNSGTSVSNSVQASSAASLTSTSVQLAPISASSSLLQQQPLPNTDLGRSDSESSVQHILQELMMSSQLNGGMPFQPGVGGTNTGGSLGVNNGIGSDMKNLNGLVPTGNGSATLKGVNGLAGNCLTNNVSVDFNNLGGIGSMPSSVNGIRSNNIGMTNNTVTLSGRANIPSAPQNLTMQDPNFNLQQDLGGNRLLNGLGTSGSYSNNQYDWKSP